MEGNGKVSEYYCHSCALGQCWFAPVEADKLNLTGSQYQLSKFIKHTSPTNLAGVVSVFDDPSYEQYKSSTVNGSTSGSLERDDKGRINLVWYAGQNNGITYRDGKFLTTTDTVKVVLANNQLKIHTFSVDSFVYETKRCGICGRDIIW